MRIIIKFWAVVAVLVLLSPLGLLLPRYFNAGGAWGEWSSEEIRRLTGFIPKGLEKWSDAWEAPMPSYSFKCWQNKGVFYSSVSYILSGIIGITAILLLIFLTQKFFINKNHEEKN